MTDREILERLLYSLAICDDINDVAECIFVALNLATLPDARHVDDMDGLFRHIQSVGLTKGLWSE